LKAPKREDKNESTFLIRRAAMSERILVVDDDRDCAEALCRLLGTLGYEAKAVYDGRQAVDEAADFLPDMVFIDIGMPGLNGYETATAIRRHRECCHAILVALTGWVAKENRQEAYTRGFDLHVAKPMSAETLTEILSLIDPAASESTAPRIQCVASKLTASDVVTRP
jgi:CheY-like chemotaxis protein